METVHVETTSRKTYFPWISWGAVFGGLASGMATYLLLTIFGIAAGLSGVDLQAAEPVGRMPMFTGIWTGLSMIASAFVGGYIATRMSGLTRRTDGLLHGFVAWGVNTLFFAYLVTTSLGAVVGGAFNALGKGLQGVGGGAAGAVATVASSPQAKGQLESFITGAGAANVSKESLAHLQDKVAARDTRATVFILREEVGFAPDRAVTVADNAMRLAGGAQQAAGQLPEKAEAVADTALSGVKAATWILFAAVALSMALSMAGGAVGAKAAARRRIPMAHA
jgi:hypothetical protein